MRILYFDIDSLRPDHLGCYGYHRDTTPNIDAMAREGVRFTHAYCATSPCVPSRGSLISGRVGVRHGAMTHFGPGSEFRFPGNGHRHWDDMPLFTRHLRRHGYRTVSFSSFADRHQAYWFCGGWSEMHTATLKQGDENADEVNAAVIPWLRANGREEDYFLHIQYWDPHRNYTVDQKWIDRFAGEPPPGWPDEEAIAGHQQDYGPFTARELFPGTPDGRSPVPSMPDAIGGVDDFKRLVDGYDAATRFMDEEIGRILNTLADLGVLEDTAIIFSADHGEALGEQGVYGDHVCAGEAVHNIPMVVRWPGGAADRAYDGLMYNVDLQPTLCELAGIPVPTGWDGLPVTAAIRGEEWAGRPHLVWDHALYSCQRAVRTPDRLFVRTYHPGLYDFDDLALFDMDADPRQTTNIAEAEPGRVAELDHVMSDWLHGMLGRHGAPGDPMQEVVRTGPYRYIRLERWIERLRARGRPDDARRIIDRLDLDAALTTRRGHPVL
ncbi:sulfatase [Nonomuraea sp. K274]|uniref:Sulfatase n=1 Tax=Nonomuraea cypriaca TaxID=1187855 RepID=A0A931A7K0_9ACTN|nr:sulfatase [Nonomuraea cypriaca]MBF8186129.1 sulfatase [Nonomuraea cypriaca]